MNYLLNSTYNNDLNRLKLNVLLNSLHLNTKDKNSLGENTGIDGRDILFNGNDHGNRRQGSFLSTATTNSEVHLLSKVRERYVKNNKLVYVHSCKSHVKKASIKGLGVRNN